MLSVIDYKRGLFKKFQEFKDFILEKYTMMLSYFDLK